VDEDRKRELLSSAARFGRVVRRARRGRDWAEWDVMASVLMHRLMRRSVRPWVLVNSFGEKQVSGSLGILSCVQVVHRTICRRYAGGVYAGAHAVEEVALEV